MKDVFYLGQKLILNSNELQDEEVTILDLTSDGCPFVSGDNFEGWVPVLKTIENELHTKGF